MPFDKLMVLSEIEGLMALSIVEGLTGGSSVLKDFLDSPVKPGNDAKKRHYSKVLKNDVDREAPPFKAGRVHFQQ